MLFFSYISFIKYFNNINRFIYSLIKKSLNWIKNLKRKLIELINKKLFNLIKWKKKKLINIKKKYV